uniref:Uncharacterized protein n=1 Tax=viral metagenome TaxID=1070528 RepID=A0A6M3IH51_9ZZZZ
MRILSVEPRDIHIVLDLSYRELEYVLKYMNRCTASPDLNDKDWEEADKYVRETFFPQLDKLSSNIKEQG